LQQFTPPLDVRGQQGNYGRVTSGGETSSIQRKHIEGKNEEIIISTKGRGGRGRGRQS